MQIITIIGAIVLTVLGCRMLFTPGQFVGFFERSTGLLQASEVASTAGRRRPRLLEYRLAGAIVAVVGILFTYIFTAAYVRHPKVTFPIMPSGAIGTGAAWHLLIIGIALSSLGILMLVKTQWFAQWSFRFFYNRVVNQRAMPKLSLRFRLYGCVLGGVGLYQVYLWIKSVLQVR